MATYPFVEEAAASAEVRAVYEDIKQTRKVDWINNFWKALAHDPGAAPERKGREEPPLGTEPGARGEAHARGDGVR